MRMQIDGVTYYDKDEVAKLFNCSTRTVRRYQLAGHFEQRKVNRSWFFTEQSVLDYLEQRGIVCYAKPGKKGGATNEQKN